jgi:predicted membrane channel-forming protein YqfA (hemolysin III family)
MHGVKWMHSIWHLFVLLGSVLQFVAVIMYIAPKG